MSKEKSINLGNIILPANDFAEQATGLIAKRGKGKSGLLKVIEEELLTIGIPFVVFDPTGIHWGIKSSFDGKKPSGFEVLVIGGPHGDLPLDRNAGRIVARAIANTNTSIIVDFKGSPHAVYRQFVAEFSDELLDINKVPRLLILEEAPRILPQKIRPDQTVSFDAAARLVLEGRNSGLGCILVSQRAATVNKDVLTQVDNMIVMGLTGPQDKKSIKEWVEENADKELLADFLTGLAGLKTREAWIWIPDNDIFKKFRTKDFKTFHPDRTHLRRMNLLESSAVITDTQSLVEQLGEDIRQFAQQAKESDPSELKRKISRLENELKQAQKIQPPPTEPEIIRVPSIEETQIKRLENLMMDIQSMTVEFWDSSDKLNEGIRLFESSKDQILSALEAVRNGHKPSPVPARAVVLPFPTPRTVHHKPPADPGQSLPIGEKKILSACAQYPDGLDRKQLTILTGYKKTSRDAYISRLLTKEYLQIGDNRKVYATQTGIDALGVDYEPLPSGQALQEYWRARLPVGERLILDQAIAAWPKDIRRNEIEGYEKTSRDAYISRLRAKEIITITGPGTIRASDNLFNL